MMFTEPQLRALLARGRRHELALGVAGLLAGVLFAQAVIACLNRWLP